jgi:hypothetical protein
MKIKFSALPTSGEKIQVSFDGGNTFTEYNVEDVRESGIQLDENQDYSLIQIKSSSSLLKNLAVVKKICLSDPDSLSSCSFITDMTVDSRWPYCVTGIVLPDGITEFTAIDDGCSCGGSYISLSTMYPNLKTIKMPNTVTVIGSYAFSNCQMESFDIPDSVNTIGDYAFSDCTGLTSITIPDSVTSIGDYAFSGCSGLTNVTIPDSVTSIGNSAFNGCPLTDECFLSIRKPDTTYGDVVYETIMTGGYYSYTVTEDGNYTVELEDSRCKDDMYSYIYINNTVKNNHDDGKGYYSFELAQGDVITVKYCYYPNHNDSLDESIEPNIGKDVFRVYKKSA